MTHYKTIEIGDRTLSYREAGRSDSPTLLLLHGFPTSSAQYQPLISRRSSPASSSPPRSDRTQ